MRRSLAAAAAAAFLLAAASPAAWPQEKTSDVPTAAAVGRPAPEIQVTDWIGGDGRTALADFRGEVVLLEFWATSCPASRSQVSHLSRLQDEYGKKGLVVVGITGEDRRQVTRYLAHADAGFSYRIGLGGASGYPSPGIPYAALVAADGTVAWLGEPGGIPKKEIEGLLKKAPKPTAETDEARAAKALATAETLVASKDLLRAEAILANASARWGATPSGKQAAARVKDLAAPEFAAEMNAQREIAKIVGGTIEKPSEADAKRMEKAAKLLEKKAAEWAESAPRAAEIALFWRDVALAPWSAAERAK
jgi:thiol-disulfide isomerase/thioredoxin